jgi:hypothetical protein
MAGQPEALCTDSDTLDRGIAGREARDRITL